MPDLPESLSHLKGSFFEREIAEAYEHGRTIGKLDDAIGWLKEIRRETASPLAMRKRLQHIRAMADRALSSAGVQLP